MQHRSASTPIYSVAPPPQRPGAQATEPPADAVDDDYFSTVWPEPTQPTPRTLQPVRPPSIQATAPRRREPIRPIPLQFAAPRFADLAPVEHGFARAIGGCLAAGILLIGLLISAQTHAGSIAPAPFASPFSSPTLNAIAARVARIAATHVQVQSVQLPFQLSIAIGSAPGLMCLLTIGIVVYCLGRRMSGVFGGLLAILLLVTCSVLHDEIQISQAIALLGVLLMAGGWRGETVIRSIAGCVMLGLSAFMSHAEALLLPILLLAAWDLPWKWSWILPLSWLATIGAIGASDWQFFNWRPIAGWTHTVSALDLHQLAAAGVRLLENHGAPLIYLLPLGIVGIGSLMKIDRRWGLTLFSMALPALSVFLLHGQTDATAFTLLLPPLILAAVWVMSRSAIAAGLITAFVCQMALRLALAA